MDEKKLHYYRIYDDQEKFNYLKCSLGHSELEQWLKEYEAKHQKYFNADLVKFLKEHDKEAEIIEVNDLSY
jgi:hypothetical protein